MVEGVVTYLLTSAVPFVLVLSLVVVVHEFGHFYVARHFGVAIKSFSLGWGAPLISRTDRHGTVWKVSQIPIGGFVSFIDDADPTSSRPAPEALRGIDPDEQKRRGYLRAQPVAVRAAIAAAGPVVNFIFAVAVFALIVMVQGKNVTDVAALSARIDTVVAGQPAALAGLRAGDVIVSIEGAPISSFGLMQETVRARPGATLNFEVRRPEGLRALDVTVGSQKAVDETGIEKTVGVLGVGRITAPDEVVVKRLNPLEAIGEGATMVWRMLAQTAQYLGNLFSGRASSEHIMGPLGIFDTSGKVTQGALQASTSAGDAVGNLAISLLGWAAMLSVAVGFANLMPIPSLDGGQLILCGLEAVRRRPLSDRSQEVGFSISALMILGLFVFATWNDLQRFKLLEFVGRILS